MSSNGDPSLRTFDRLRTEDAELAQVLETCVAALEACQLRDLEREVAAHPVIADRLRSCLAVVQMIERCAGHFSILRSPCP